jgi:hypothetical protein
VSAFKSGFDAGLDAVQLLFMQSDGGLAPANDFSGHKAILSGPAGAAGCRGISAHLRSRHIWGSLGSCSVAHDAQWQYVRCSADQRHVSC